METPTFLYKPNFCKECGEKIERESWHLWTNRDFCDNCAPVFWLSALMPSLLGGVVLLFGGIFLGSLGQKQPKPVMMAANPPQYQQNVEPKPLVSSNQPVQPIATPVETPAANGNSQANSNVSNASKQPLQSIKPAPTTEAVYICGARTQKGTPCSRRVKIPGRCWQHPGKPSLLEKMN